MGLCFSDTRGGEQSIGGLGKGDFDAGNATLEALDAMVRSRGLSSMIELSLSASSLKDRDVLSKSDPMVVMYSKKRDGSLEELGRTEVVLNSLDPSWITKLKITFLFEEVQPILFRIYDVDSSFGDKPAKSIPLERQQFLGEIDCFLSEVVTAKNQTLKRALKHKGDGMAGTGSKESGVLMIKAEEMAHSKEFVEMELSCSHIVNKEVFTKSDPFLIIHRLREDGSFLPVYKSEVKKNDLNPIWKKIKLTFQQLSNGDMFCPLKIECLDFNSSGSHGHIGVVMTSLDELQKMVEQQEKGMDLIHPSSKKVGGKLVVRNCSLKAQHTFLDYIMGGCDLNFMVAIDFTASNGNPYQADSLHYIDPSGRLNAYQAAILSVAEVLDFFDSDKRYIAWGFGGKPSKDQHVSHCFNLSGHAQMPEVQGIQGIMNTYAQAIRNVQLAGPTIFGPVIRRATEIAQQGALSQEHQKYFVLLIITDGVITDLQESINALVDCSSFPLSILIVGIGGADFSEMEILDADKNKLKSMDPNGKVAVRDIVQFVPMRNATGSMSVAQSLLAELPTQLLDFMSMNKIVPNPPLRSNSLSL